MLGRLVWTWYTEPRLVALTPPCGVSTRDAELKVGGKRYCGSELEGHQIA